MLARDVPKCFRGSVALSDAYSQGCAAGRAGVAAEGNPWLEKGPEHRCGVTDFGPADHAIREGTGTPPLAYCGLHVMRRMPWRFEVEVSAACKRCIRAVEAERKRLAESWESGRLSTHPK